MTISYGSLLIYIYTHDVSFVIEIGNYIIHLPTCLLSLIYRFKINAASYHLCHILIREVFHEFCQTRFIIKLHCNSSIMKAFIPASPQSAYMLLDSSPCLSGVQLFIPCVSGLIDSLEIPSSMPRYVRSSSLPITI